jgi:hypothetical protein
MENKHRLRNTLVAGVGAGVGAGIGAVLGGLGGAVVGILLPSHSTIYQVSSH